MSPSVDSAILAALNLDKGDTTIASVGGSGFSSTFKLSTTKDGQPFDYFVKTGSGEGARIMFQVLTPSLIGEHASLNAIHNAVPNFCPKSYSHGPMQQSNKYFLATDFLQLGYSSSKGSGISLAAKLAKLHTTPAPIPEGFDKPMFGFPVPTCCGDTEQDNSWKSSWAEFYADNRLRFIIKRAVKNHGPDGEAVDMIEKVASRVIPRLIGDDHISITPVVIHGDLWSGNHSTGQIAGQGGREEVVFDPSCVYGHSEYELGIMKMFGGFDGSFWSEYEKLVPKAEPKEEWDDRVMLYELLRDK
ncbi:phosphotransferase enzyme family [Trichoderma arundinaceum]|uniref:protein-ribulosamine 3-kinase n=1 Tax=Trichoderma arundinaceum TaxID=490622 RepID=A0A395NXK2_TRIAR|nr:phosphotransferase enzyme family [Trichoderma arundinaceum]